MQIDAHGRLLCPACQEPMRRVGVMPFGVNSDGVVSSAEPGSLRNVLFGCPTCSTETLIMPDGVVRPVGIEV